MGDTEADEDPNYDKMTDENLAAALDEKIAQELWADCATISRHIAFRRAEGKRKLALMSAIELLEFIDADGWQDEASKRQSELSSALKVEEKAAAKDGNYELAYKFQMVRLKIDGSVAPVVIQAIADHGDSPQGLLDAMENGKLFIASPSAPTTPAAFTAAAVTAAAAAAEAGAKAATEAKKAATEAATRAAREAAALAAKEAAAEAQLLKDFEPIILAGDVSVEAATEAVSVAEEAIKEAKEVLYQACARQKIIREAHGDFKAMASILSQIKEREVPELSAKSASSTSSSSSAASVTLASMPLDATAEIEAASWSQSDRSQSDSDDQSKRHNKRNYSDSVASASSSSSSVASPSTAKGPAKGFDSDGKATRSKQQKTSASSSSSSSSGVASPPKAKVGYTWHARNQLWRVSKTKYGPDRYFIDEKEAKEEVERRTKTKKS